jgi:hypothetical protein
MHTQSTHNFSRVNHSSTIVNHHIPVVHPKNPSNTGVSSISASGNKASNPSWITNFCNWIVSLFKSCLECCFPSKKPDAVSQDAAQKPKLLSQDAMKKEGKTFINSLMQQGLQNIKDKPCKALFLFKIDDKVADAYWGYIPVNKASEFTEKLEKTLANATKDKQGTKFEVDASFIETLAAPGTVPTYNYFRFDKYASGNGNNGINSTGDGQAVVKSISSSRIEDLLKYSFKGKCISEKQEQAYREAMVTLAHPFKRPQDYNKREDFVAG